MDTSLYYFSGTGNSLYVSKRIAERLENVTAKPITSLLTSPTAKRITAQTVGFVFPVYFLAMPEYVKKAVQQCNFPADTYFFAAVTSGGDSGNTLYELDEILRSKNSRLHYGTEIPLGDNSIALRTPANKIQKWRTDADLRVDRLVRAVQARDLTAPNTIFRKKVVAVIQGSTIQFAMWYYYRYEDRKIDRTVCTNCGLCQKTCPVNNIRYEQGKIQIADNCANCFACINACPRQAISFGRIHPRKETQYRGPS